MSVYGGNKVINTQEQKKKIKTPASADAKNEITTVNTLSRIQNQILRS
jgi:hypothetical protein